MIKKIAIQILILIIGSGNVLAADANLKMQGPPYWLSSYNEFKNFQQNQKAYYLGRLITLVESTPGLKKIKKDEILKAAKNRADWDELREKIYKFCSDKSEIKTCENLADIRGKSMLIDPIIDE